MNNGRTSQIQVSSKQHSSKLPIFEERSYIPKKLKGGSIIKTKNLDLLALLRENSKAGEDMSKPVRRVYVDSPVFTRDDENEYQFVNPEIDDDIGDEPQFEQKAGRDRNMLDNQNSRRRYDMRERDSLGDSLEDSSDELKREEEYQAQLKSRITQASNHDALKLKYDIPDLDLDKSTDSLEDSPKDSIEDSLDADAGGPYNEGQPDPYKDSLDWSNPPPNPFAAPSAKVAPPNRALNEPDWSDYNNGETEGNEEGEYEGEDPDNRYEDMNDYDGRQQNVSDSLDDERVVDRNNGVSFEDQSGNTYQAEAEYRKRLPTPYKSGRNQDLPEEGEEFDRSSQFDQQEDPYQQQPQRGNKQATRFRSDDDRHNFQQEHKVRGKSQFNQEDPTYGEEPRGYAARHSGDKRQQKRRQASGNYYPEEDNQQYDVNGYPRNEGARRPPHNMQPSQNYQSVPQNFPQNQQVPQNFSRQNYHPDYQRNYEAQNAQFYMNGSQNFQQPIPMQYQHPQNFQPQGPMMYQPPFQQPMMAQPNFVPVQPPPLQNYYGQPVQFQGNQFQQPVNQSAQFQQPSFQGQGQYYPQQPQFQQQPAPNMSVQPAGDEQYQQPMGKPQVQNPQPQMNTEEQHSQQRQQISESTKPPIPKSKLPVRQQLKQQEETPRSVRKSPLVEKSPRLNFVEFNKKLLVEGPPKKGYGDRFKEKRENFSPVSENGRTTRTVHKPPVARTKAASAGEIGRLDKTVSAEDLWKERAQRLYSSKQQASSAGKKSSGRVKPLKKYASDSGLNIKKQPARAPHFVQPLPNRPVVETSTSAPAWSDDQQRVSVDINLKLISPQPPLAPINRIQQTHDTRPSQEDYEGYQNFNPRGQPQAEDNWYPQNQNNYNNRQQYGDYTSGGHPADRGQYGQKDSGYSNSSNYGQQYSNKENEDEYEVEDQGYYDETEENYEDENGEPVFASPRDNLSTTRDSPNNVNPYQKIPPISSQKKGGQTNGGEGGGSYVQEYSKQKQRANKKPSYQKYTIEDYRKLKMEISLGGLGPTMDEDTWKEKAEKRRRQLNYAKQVAIENRPAQGRVKQVRYPREVEEEDIMNKRKVAIEYSKSVPKPKVVPKNNGYGAPALQRAEEDETEAYNLRKLQERHERDKVNIAELRSNVNSVMSTAR